MAKEELTVVGIGASAGGLEAFFTKSSYRYKHYIYISPTPLTNIQVYDGRSPSKRFNC